jgi:alpha-tubulin suppressor-like RCC1 family protein
VSKNGEVFVCGGNNRQGQLGIGETTETSGLTQLVSMKGIHIESVFLEEFHTIFLEKKILFDFYGKEYLENIMIYFKK